MTTQQTQKLATELALAVTRTGATPVKILLVEDNPDDVVVARTAFKKTQVANELYVARDGQEALDFLFGGDKSASFPDRILPDLIVLDLGLPGVSGMEVLKKIRASDELSKIAVIMLTASDRPGDIVNSDRLGARVYLQKPIEVGKLVHAIEVLSKLGIVFAELPRGGISLMADEQPSHVLHILLVEDNELDVEIAKRVFARSGVAAYLHIVRDGPEAVDFLYQHRYRGNRFKASPMPDLVLLDLNLPMGSGPDILRQMKADSRLSPIPVVVLTANSSERVLRECMELGTNLYLLKPIAIADVMNMVVGVQKYWGAIEKLERGAA